MATLRGAVVALLAADPTLAGYLTGGVHDRRELSRTATATAYDSRGKLLPSAVVTVEATTPHGPKEFDFERVFFVVWLYEAEGNHYATIDLARDQVRLLLHRQTVAIDTGAVHEILHAEGSADSYDDALGAEMAYERFYAWRNRA